MDIKDEASIINSDENVVSDVEQADLSINHISECRSEGGKGSI